MFEHYYNTKKIDSTNGTDRLKLTLVFGKQHKCFTQVRYINFLQFNLFFKGEYINVDVALHKKSLEIF